MENLGYLTDRINDLDNDLLRAQKRIAELEAENSNFCEEISNLTGAVDRLQMQKAKLVELFEKSHAECNDLSNEKLEILDRLVRLEAENISLRRIADKDCEYFEGRKIRITKI